MFRAMTFLAQRVIILTISLSISGCATSQRFQHGLCKTHAYIQWGLQDYLRSRYYPNAPVRMAIIPFTTPANLSSSSGGTPAMGSELAWKVHTGLLSSEQVPVVEVLSREDWPGKKDEFFTGNYGAINRARQADYDLLMVGYMPAQGSIDSFTAYSKIIEADSGITVWYGKTTATVPIDRPWGILQTLGYPTSPPAELPYSALLQDTAMCITLALTDPDIQDNNRAVRYTTAPVYEE